MPKTPPPTAPSSPTVHRASNNASPASPQASRSPVQGRHGHTTVEVADIECQDPKHVPVPAFDDIPPDSAFKVLPLREPKPSLGNLELRVNLVINEADAQMIANAVKVQVKELVDQAEARLLARYEELERRGVLFDSSDDSSDEGEIYPAQSFTEISKQ